jgi:hypothetical protein
MSIANIDRDWFKICRKGKSHILLCPFSKLKRHIGAKVKKQKGGQRKGTYQGPSKDTIEIKSFKPRLPTFQ